ncbi:MAG TPA: response regulator [bacterium]|nr:response regulator [bacterium]
MMRRILFVDDEPRVLEGLRRMLHSLRGEWDMEFAQSGQEALESLDTKEFDVIVSDMRMPAMDGAELLSKVRDRHPQIARIVLSGQSDSETILRSVEPAHQYLSKPCDAATMKSTIDRTLALRELISNDVLQTLVTMMESLPCLPSIYTKLMQELRSPSPSINKIGQIISSDVSMTAKILQLVNSAFFGVSHHISGPTQAVNLLGLQTVRALVLVVRVFSQFKGNKQIEHLVEELWKHSIVVGSAAKSIASAENAARDILDDAFMAGLLHDVGKLVLATNLPDQYARAMKLAQEGDMSVVSAEREVFGAAHPDVGAYLLGLWGLPDPIVEAVAFHHRPSDSRAAQFATLTAVHVANAMEHQVRSGKGCVEGEIDLSHLSDIGLSDRLDAWRATSIQITDKENDNA